MGKQLKRLFVLFLCTAMVLCLVPADAVVRAEEQIGAITEVVSLREENVKHFDLGNGTYHAVAYSHPVHELDSEGNWVDINTALSTGNARSLGQYATEDGSVTVSQTFRPNSQIIGLQEDGKGISMAMVAGDSSVSTFSMSRAAVENAPVRTAQTEYQTIEEAASGDYSSTVYYENVLPNTDLEYIVDIDMVKENIIVKAAQESYSYTFSLDLTGMYAQLEEEGSVSLIDSATQERRYMIPAPYMYDALGNASFDAAYTLTQENSTYYLTVTADTDWINAQGRQFPVTIDPSVMGVSDAIADTYIDSLYPAVNYGDSRALWARVNRISYFQCSLPSFPDRAELDHAYLSVHYGYLNTVESGYVRVGAYRVTMPWQESVLTWSSATNYTTYGIDTAVLHDDYELYAGQGATLSSPDEQRFYITPVVQAWLDKECPNYGIALKFIDGTNKSVVFKSNETEAENRPKFHYAYTMPDQVNVDVMYDVAYANRYSDAVSRINRELGVLKDFYLNEFDILLNFSTPHSFSCYACTECTTLPAVQCTHGSNESCKNSVLFEDKSEMLYSYHHTNLHNIGLRVSEPNLLQTLRVVYIGHDHCTPGLHITTNALKGVAWELQGIAVVSNFDSESYETTTLIHEFSHLYGTIDYYSGTGKNVGSMNAEFGRDDFSDSCMYGYDYENETLISNHTMCSGCKSIILSNRDRYNH